MSASKRKNGILTLVPTPIAEYGQLESYTFELLELACKNFQQNLILVEDLKPARRRWSHWGLPREAFDHFIAFNEHTKEELRYRIIEELQKGRNAFLMSDGGLPAFCDPGVKLVDACHKHHIQVTSTPFNHSVALSIALSGIESEPYLFLGFPPRKSEERKGFIERHLKERFTTVWMDTPYRLKKLVEEMMEVDSKRDICLCLDLGRQSEWVYRGSLQGLLNKVENWKREFVMVVSPC